MTSLHQRTGLPGFVWRFEAFRIRAVCGDDVVHDSQNAVDSTHDVLRLPLFLRPPNTAGERHRPAIDMHPHFLRNAGMIVSAFLAAEKISGSER